MDTSTAIVTAILIGISIIPFTLMARRRKKEEQHCLQSLTNLANKYECQISQHEICGDFGIGIDDNKNAVLYFEQMKDKIIEVFIDLTTVQKCSVNRTTHSTSVGNDSVIDKLELSFSPLVKDKPDILLEFFNIERCSHLNGELQTAEKWSKMINDRLRFDA